jgi:hypothetical protein
MGSQSDRQRRKRSAPGGVIGLSMGLSIRIESIRESEVFMKRSISLVLVIGLALFALSPLGAQVSASSVGLGLAAGAALPQGQIPGVISTDWQPSFNWGFYVNIPLIYTFHITPSSELYTLGSQNATDFDISFKFIVPLSDFNFYAGFAPGLTAVSEILAPHVGFLAGGGFTLISNLEAFVQAKYTYVFQGNQNLGVFHVNAGVLFTF